MEVLEGILSFFVAIFAGIAIGIGFAVKTLISVLLYLLGNLIGLVCPPLRYRIRMRYLLRDADLPKDSRLRTGLFARYEMKGGASDKPFAAMKRCMNEYKQQKSRRSAYSGQSELKEIFKRFDRLYDGFLKQFYLAAQTVHWKKLDPYQPNQQPAFANLEKAVRGMEMLLQEHEKTLSGANGNAMPDEADLMQQLDYLRDFNAVQAEEAAGQTQQMQ